jgi:hypothetical protein
MVYWYVIANRFSELKLVRLCHRVVLNTVFMMRMKGKVGKAQRRPGEKASDERRPE